MDRLAAMTILVAAVGAGERLRCQPPAAHSTHHYERRVSKLEKYLNVPCCFSVTHMVRLAERG